MRIKNQGIGPIYRVTWTIDVEADNPRQAAEVANSRMLRSPSAQVYTVRQQHPVVTGRQHIDLAVEEEREDE